MTEDARPADRFNLQRFVDAQAPVYRTVVAELQAGKKRTHWMWFIFPQLAGLGTSAMAQRYALASHAEAAAYLAHPVLGPRLHDCMQTLLAGDHRTALAIFGAIDARKLHSCASLFAHVAPDDAVFQRVLARYFGGSDDAATRDLLAGEATAPAGRRH